MTRIAFDYQAFSLQSYGGISRYFTCLAQQLIDLRQQVKVFAPLHRNRYLGALPSGVVNGREFIKFPPQNTKYSKELIDLLLSMMKKDPS